MKNCLAFVILDLLLQAGCCQSPALVEGGTAESLVAGKTPVPDVEIKIFAEGVCDDHVQTGVRKYALYL